MIETENGRVRTFEELTETEQTEAERLALDRELLAVVEGALRFNDEANEDDVQARIDAAAAEMERMRTPRLLAERLMEDETVADTLRGLARCAAEDAAYPDPGVVVFKLERKP